MVASPNIFMNESLNQSFFDEPCGTLYLPVQCTEVRFASFLSGGFTTMAVINQPERKLADASMCIVLKLIRLSVGILCPRD